MGMASSESHTMPSTALSVSAKRISKIIIIIKKKHIILASLMVKASLNLIVVFLPGYVRSSIINARLRRGVR